MGICANYNSIDEEIFKEPIVDFKLIQGGEYDGQDWIWEISLANSKKYRIDAWCDYSGWGCQSAATCEEI